MSSYIECVSAASEHNIIISLQPEDEAAREFGKWSNCEWCWWLNCVDNEGFVSFLLTFQNFQKTQKYIIAARSSSSCNSRVHHLRLANPSLHIFILQVFDMKWNSRCSLQNILPFLITFEFMTEQFQWWWYDHEIYNDVDDDRSW